MSKKIHFIINPAAGQDFPILNTINKVCERHNCSWTVSVTQKDNFKSIIDEAIKADAEIIAVYGGDGTVAEVANHLINSDKVLGILPGGSANVLSSELGIPQDIGKACRLICKEKVKIKEIDAGKVNDKIFLLRVGFGFEAEAVKAADREFKNMAGILAYALSGLRALVKVKPVQYQFELDGKQINEKGLSLVVANSGNLGVSGVSLLPKIDIADGLLDVILIRTGDLQKIFTKNGDKIPISEHLKLFKHWQVKKFSTKVLTKQAIHYDGEILKERDINIEILPQSLRVVC